MSPRCHPLVTDHSMTSRVPLLLLTITMTGSLMSGLLTALTPGPGAVMTLFWHWSDSAQSIYLIQLSSLEMRDTELCSTQADTETWSCLLLAGWCLCVYWCTAQYTTVHSPPADVSTNTDHRPLGRPGHHRPARSRRPGCPGGPRSVLSCARSPGR